MDEKGGKGGKEMIRIEECLFVLALVAIFLQWRYNKVKKQ